MTGLKTLLLIMVWKVNPKYC